MTSVAIEVNSVWKKFKLPHEKKTTLFENLSNILLYLRGTKGRYHEFWALKGVNLRVYRGECLGIIGENGSGKTTLLKIITNILRPTRGVIRTSGRLAAILELGVGFHPDLTVKENIQVYGSILGLSNKKIEEKFDSILDFAELKRFQNARLKSLSSGMQMRLAFSVVSETDPDIFLIDEALAIGDAHFQRKCFERFKLLKDKEKTIVLVSHDMNLHKAFCDRVLVLSQGEKVFEGDVTEGISFYEKISQLTKNP